MLIKRKKESKPAWKLQILQQYIPDHATDLFHFVIGKSQTATQENRNQINTVNKVEKQPMNNEI